MKGLGPVIGLLLGIGILVSGISIGDRDMARMIGAGLSSGSIGFFAGHAVAAARSRSARAIRETFGGRGW